MSVHPHGWMMAPQMRGPPTEDPNFGQELAVLMDKLPMPVRESLMRLGTERVHRLMELYIQRGRWDFALRRLIHHQSMLISIETSRR